MTYADGSSGSWLEALNSEYEHPYVVITDTRAYSSTARQFCRVAAERPHRHRAGHRYLVPVGPRLSPRSAAG
ncbi:Uncharacterised protein [Raoultella terrigena]|uniref:Uncharacterized protein n=1 Tax=Raoultella terrigena TaxID=577 RepID=A0A4U9D1N1_RAOTE|nr:Uncharacterised protein [Raoultella terrigena]